MTRLFVYITGLAWLDFIFLLLLPILTGKSIIDHIKKRNEPTEREQAAAFLRSEREEEERLERVRSACLPEFRAIMDAYRHESFEAAFIDGRFCPKEASPVDIEPYRRRLRTLFRLRGQTRADCDYWVRSMDKNLLDALESTSDDPYLGLF